ncbi:MAG: FkbM family methyltransferase [Planctomycetaceae bacterium]|nr:FkbM family methyltransferase [Planctomycetaceae bacterium]
MPKVSVCIPAYNQPELLRKTLNSVITQSFENYEIIVTDDSTDDRVERLIKEFSPNPNIRYYKNEKPKGSPQNWNYAVSLATGEYIKLMHHDDWFENQNSLCEFVRLLDSNPKADFAFSACLAKDLDDTLKFVHKPNPEQIKKLHDNPDILFFGNFIGSPSTTIFRKKIDASFDPKLKWIVDTDFYIRVLCKHKFIYSSSPLLCITTGTAQQVTGECCNNKQVELFEYIYVSGKLKSAFPNFRRIWFFAKLFKKYHILTFKDIYDVDNSRCINAKEVTIALLLNKIIFYGERITQYPRKILRHSSRIMKSKKNIFDLIRLVIAAFVSKKYFYFKSYSQCGEDLIVSYILKNYLKIEFPSYLDIGTNDPVHFNNTYYFYRANSKGVCIEPNPELFKKIKKIRPKDICLNVGIGSKNIKSADFYVLSSDTLSSFSKDEAERLCTLHAQKSEKILKIPVVNINEIIEKYFEKTPNFVSIDTEGMDLEILNAINFLKFRPEVFCIETLTYVEDKSERKINEISSFMKDNGYVIYADTYINTIYVDENAWKKR